MTRHFIPILCNHCADGPCLDACPTGAILRCPSGEVEIEEGDRNLNRFQMVTGEAPGSGR